MRARLWRSPANTRRKCEYVTLNCNAAATAPGRGRYFRFLVVWHAIYQRMVNYILCECKRKIIFFCIIFPGS
jgi:hypothetical protein